MLGLFIYTMTADDRYSLRNSNNLLQPIQMQLSKKQTFFFSIFFGISKIYIKFWTFWKNDDPHSLRISKIRNCERNGELNT